MSNANSKDVPTFMKLFWEEKQKYLSASSSKSVRYHPMIIRYCLGLAAKSTVVYDEIRFNEKTNSGFRGFTGQPQNLITAKPLTLPIREI